MVGEMKEYGVVELEIVKSPITACLARLIEAVGRMSFSNVVYGEWIAASATPCIVFAALCFVGD